MTREAEIAMNRLTIEEMDALNTGCGFVAIIGNGQLCAVTTEDKAEEQEEKRCACGY